MFSECLLSARIFHPFWGSCFCLGMQSNSFFCAREPKSSQIKSKLGRKNNNLLILRYLLFILRCGWCNDMLHKVGAWIPWRVCMGQTCHQTEVTWEGSLLGEGREKKERETETETCLLRETAGGGMGRASLLKGPLHLRID